MSETKEGLSPALEVLKDDLKRSQEWLNSRLKRKTSLATETKENEDEMVELEKRIDSLKVAINHLKTKGD